jgi:predicted dehydrogenase
MRVSIIGAGRNRNGIGEYIGKYFHARGARVTSVLGTTDERSQGAAAALGKYGIDATPYTNLYRMLEREKPDAVVIASPSTTHYEYLTKCVEAGVNIFCEKPFVWDPPGDLEKTVKELLGRAREKKLTLAMNSQWVFALKPYEELCGRIDTNKTNRFNVLMSPFSPGKEMIPESVPHPLSLLYSSLGEGEIRDLSFESPEERAMLIRFTYGAGQGDWAVTLRLASQKTQPREFQFGFNGRIVNRKIETGNYGIHFQYGAGQVKIVDPLDLSVRNFIEAVRDGAEPVVGASHILSNTLLLKQIYDRCTGPGKKESWKN